MGLFSSKKETYVSGTVYNLAGALSDRPDFMKSVITNSALGGQDLTKSIVNATLNGPAKNLVKFFTWAARSYPGSMPRTDLDGEDLRSLVPLQTHIPHPAGSEVWVISGVVTEPDVSLWAEDYLLANRPELVSKPWTADINRVTGQLIITFGNPQYPPISFLAPAFSRADKYIAAKYAITRPGSSGPVVSLGTVSNISTIEGCGVRGYVAGDPVTTPNIEVELVDKVTTTRSFSDGSPREVTVVETPTTVYYPQIDRTFTLTTGLPPVRSTGQIRRRITTKAVTRTRRVFTSYSRVVTHETDSETGVITTTVVATENQSLRDHFSVTTSQQDHIHAVTEQPQIFLYRIGSGNAALDALSTRTVIQRDFFPVIPVRLDNHFINANGDFDGVPFSEIYDAAAPVYKKGFGTEIDDLIDQLKENENLDDIDFAYIAYGVVVNERDAHAKRYIYAFLKSLIEVQHSSKAAYDGAAETLRSSARQEQDWNFWNNHVQDMFGPEPSDEPPRPSYPRPQRTEISLNPQSPGNENYRISWRWTYIHETIMLGKKPGKKLNDIWWESAPDTAPVSNTSSGPVSFLNTGAFTGIGEIDRKRVYLYWQDREHAYRRLEIVGMHQSNYVYKDKSSGADLDDAVKSLLDEDGGDGEDESEFFFPLSRPVLAALPVRTQNQLAGCCRLLVLNSYVTKKIRWYQRGIFKVIFMVAAIVLSFVFMNPAALGSAAGLLGTNAAVGAMIGLSGSAAIIAGAAVNAFAAMLLTTVLSKVSVKVFGEKWGAIIGAVVSFIALGVGANFAATGNFSLDISQFMRVDNIMRLTESVGKSYTTYLRGETVALQEGYETALDEYKDQMDEIAEKVDEMFGQSAWINPMLMTEVGDSSRHSLRESSSTFLERTLLTGADICELTHGMIEDFVDLSLTIPDPIM